MRKTESNINVPQQELDRIISKITHAIGYNENRVYTRYKKRYFLVWRNYYAISESGNDPDWECMEKLGYAEKSGQYTFHLTEKGIAWASQLLNVHFYMPKEKEQPYPIDVEEEEEITRIWDWCKKHDAFVFRHYATRDVQILIETNNLDSFCQTFSDEEDYGIPSRVSPYGVVISFFDLLPFCVTADQVWNLRPAEMREEL